MEYPDRKSMGILGLGVYFALALVFLTGCGGGGSGPGPSDSIPPSVVSTTPVNGATNVGVDVTLLATFTEPMDTATINGSTITLYAGAVQVPGNVSSSHNMVTFSPVSKLGSGTTYTVTIAGGPSGVKDMAGNPLPGDYKYTFSTQQNPDLSPPLVIATYPVQGAAGISVYAAVTAVFSEAVTNVSIDTFRLEADGINVPGVVSIKGSTAVFTPSVLLNPLTTYTATITSEVRDLMGNSLAADNTWTFGTGEKGWEAPELIEKALGNAEFPEVAMDGKGNAVAVWHQYDGPAARIYANRYVPGTGWGLPISVDNGSGEARLPQLAVDTSGNAIVIWEQGEMIEGISYQNVYANRFTPGTGWGTPTLVETGSGYAQCPHVAMDGIGNAVAVWRQVESGVGRNIYASRYSIGTGWETPSSIETEPGDVLCPQVAMDSNGNAVVVWPGGGNLDGANSSIYANRFTSGTGWGTASLIETSSGSAYGPRVGMDGAGNAIVVWYQSDGLFTYNTWANHFTPGKGWMTPTMIGPAEWASLGPPRLAVNGAGDAIAVWWYWGADIYATLYAPGTGWGEPIVVSNGAGGFPDVAMDTGGNAIVAWTQHDGTTEHIYANRYVRGLGWGVPTLTETGPAEDKWPIGGSSYPEVVMDTDGNGIVVWMRYDGKVNNVFANRYVKP